MRREIFVTRSRGPKAHQGQGEATLDTQATAPDEITQLFEDMVGADGYSVVVHEWPASGAGHAKLEVVAGADACVDCLVPKKVLAQVLVRAVSPGILIDEDDITYPAEAH